MLSEQQQRQYLARIESALLAAEGMVKACASGDLAVRDDGGCNVVTELDRRICELLRRALVRDGEGWLCEEDPDDPSRLSRDLIWVVDPLDGTREFVDGIPEWCVSIGLVEDGIAVAGGTLNPATAELFLGASHCGVTYNHKKVQTLRRSTAKEILVLASRSEYTRGEWRRFENGRFNVRPMGSVAYKLSLVAAGMAHATWTLNPRREWDIAAGVALIHAAGGRVACIDGGELRFNRRDTLIRGLVASCPCVWGEIGGLTRFAREHF
jgi:myo-inositol-1(or 4)-monophosphatase